MDNLISGEFVYFNERLSCPNNCGRSFKHKNDMVYHYKTECGQKFVCLICHKTISTKCNLIRHIALVHNC